MKKFYRTAHITGDSAIKLSYRTALYKYRTMQGLARISWVTWLTSVGMLVLWGFTAYQVAQLSGALGLRDIITHIASNALTIQEQDNEALTTVLLAYGAKDNALLVQGQYWRFVTPIFLHANALHVSMNVLNLLVLGVFLERLVGHLRFLFIFLVSGVVSVIASFYFLQQEISVGASGTIFGLVGAYSVFVLLHRRALRHGGIPSIFWLVMVIGANLGIGFFVQNVDNYAHVGGLLSGCFLGWWFTPCYVASYSFHRPATQVLTDIHSLSRRWPLALLTILGTLVLAIIALYLIETNISL